MIMLMLDREAIDLAQAAANYVKKALQGTLNRTAEDTFEVETAKGNKVIITADTVNTSTIQMFKKGKGRIRTFESNPKAHRYIMQELIDTANRY